MMMTNITKICRQLLIGLPILGLPLWASANIGLIVYDDMSPTSYLANAGHSGVYLSNVCMTAQVNKFEICTDADRTNGVAGVVVQRYSDLAPGTTNNDWIALPLNVNLYGTENPGDSPIVGTPQVLKVLRSEAYNSPDLELNQFMTPIQAKNEKATPPIPDGNWQYAIGMNEIRAAHIVLIPTTTDEDQRVVDWLNTDENVSHFSIVFNNCANLANSIFKVAKGEQFNGRGELEDLFLVTPSSDAKAVKKEAGKEDVPYMVVSINQEAGTFKASSTPSEMMTGSNTSLLMTLPAYALSFPGALIFTGLKFVRKLGIPVPGYRPYMDLSGKEVLQHGTPELAQATFDLQQAQKAKASSEEISALKSKITSLQAQAFGTNQCWSAQEKKFESIIEKAIDAEVVDAAYRKEFQIHNFLDKVIRLIPMAHQDPTQSKLLGAVAASPGTSVENTSSGLALEKDGVTAGLTRDDLLKFDQKLGFLIIASSIDYDLATPADRRPMAASFDADWALMVSTGKNAGLQLGADDEASIEACSQASSVAQN